MSSKSTKNSKPSISVKEEHGEGARPDSPGSSRDSNDLLETILLRLGQIQNMCEENARRIEGLDSRLSLGDMAELESAQRDVDAAISNERDDTLVVERTEEKRKSLFIREAKQSDDREVK